MVVKHSVCDPCFSLHWQQVKAGFVLNIIGVITINIALNTWGAAMFNLNTFPDWANVTTIPTPWSRDTRKEGRREGGGGGEWRDGKRGEMLYVHLYLGQAVNRRQCWWSTHSGWSKAATVYTLHITTHTVCLPVGLVLLLHSVKVLIDLN